MRTPIEALAYERAVTALNLQQQPACVLLLVFPGGGCVIATLTLTLAMAILSAGSTSATSEVSRANGRAKSAGRHNQLVRTDLEAGFIADFKHSLPDCQVHGPA